MSLPVATDPLSPLLVDLIAQRFRVIGEPMRIRILDHLRPGPATVGELSSALGASQQNVSKHLGVLRDAVENSRLRPIHPGYRDFSAVIREHAYAALWESWRS